MADLEFYTRYVPGKVENGMKNAFGLLRGVDDEHPTTSNGRIEGQREPLVRRNTPADWSSWAIFRLVDHAIHNNMEDWAVVIEICNKLGRNDKETEQSFELLIDNIRSSDPAIQLLTAKLWIIMVSQCLPYFANHMPRLMLLETIEDVALSSHTSPVVRDRLIEVVGAAVFLLKGAKTLKPYQSTWIKLREELNLIHPVEGLIITADDPILSPSSPMTRTRLSQNPPSQPFTPSRPAIPGQTIAPSQTITPISIPSSSQTESEQTPVQETRDRKAEQEYERLLTRSPKEVPILEQDSDNTATNAINEVWWLFEECETARSNCRILGDSLLHATSDSVLKDPIIKEFQEKAVASKEIIDAHIDSAKDIADRARMRRRSGESGDPTSRTEEERLLQALFITRAELKNVLQTYKEFARLARTKLRTDSRDVPISREMTEAEVVSHLIAHGCKDLTNSLDLSSFDEYPTSHGGFSDVYHGRLSDGTEVAMKLLRVSASSFGRHPKHLKHAAREIHTWSKCNHPNVVSLCGLAVFRCRIGMASPWMSQGNLPHYLEHKPDADRQKLCVQICEGLDYLHQIGIIHGDLKGANVLISDDGSPVLTDFGNAFLIDRTLKFTPTTSSGALTVRWSSAEVIDGARPTKASDVYALAMTLYEVVPGQLPYLGHSDITIILLVMVRKEPPERPECIPTGHQDGEKLWNLFLRCWSYEPEARPNAAEVAREASQIKTIAIGNLPRRLPRQLSTLSRASEI